MAQGESKVFNDFQKKLGDGDYKLAVDGMAIHYVSDTYSTIDENVVNPNISSFTPLSGGNFASTALTGLSWSRINNITTLNFNPLATVPKDALNPSNIRTAILAFTTNGDIYKAVDLTVDGLTPIDVVNNDFDYAPNAAGSMTQTVI